jgi:pSer/pThr/pTyr-binding forkhead associated (FHA) protein
MKYHLPMSVQVRSGPNAGEQFRIDLGATTIGRGAGNNIPLDDPAVSPRHARFDQEGENYFIADLGSSKGTFVNGKRIKGRQPLSQGDEIRVGGTILQVGTSFVSQPSTSGPPPQEASSTTTETISNSLLVIIAIALCGVLVLMLGALAGFERQMFPAPFATVVSLALNLTSNRTPTAIQITVEGQTTAPLATSVPSATPTFTPTETETPTLTSTPRPTDTPTPTPTATATRLPRRLDTGTILKDKGIRDGLGQLTIDDSQGLDAVVVLATLQKETVFSVYIRGGDSYRVTSIRDGTFYIYVTQGEDWDKAAARFTRSVRYLRFEQTATFVTTAIKGGRQYTTLAITLYSVPGGTAILIPVSESDFPAQQ